MQTALIPLGRSLQRYAASPDYFASPRLVVAVTGDGAAGPGVPRLADRLFLGYQPAAEVIEAISYNADAGALRVSGDRRLRRGGGRRQQPAERRVCLACHQGRGPDLRPPALDARPTPTRRSPLASRRSARASTARRSRQSVDGSRPSTPPPTAPQRIALADRLWSEACATPPAAPRCSLAALRVGLGGPPAAGAARLRRAQAPRWPDGLAAMSPDLPNRDPLLTWSARRPRDHRRLDPETPRETLVLWRPGPDGFAAAAREIAGQLTAGDLAGSTRPSRTRGRHETLTLALHHHPGALPTGGKRDPLRLHRPRRPA